MKKINSEKAPKAIGPYSQAVSFNNMVFTSGQIPLNINGEIVGNDISTQTEQVIKNLSAVLEEAGTNFNNVIKTTCFLANMQDFQKFNEVYASHFISNPARSCVAVKELPKQVLVEIEVIAYIS